MSAPWVKVLSEPFLIMAREGEASVINLDEAYRSNVEWDIAKEDGVISPLMDGAL